MTTSAISISPAVYDHVSVTDAQTDAQLSSHSSDEHTVHHQFRQGRVARAVVLAVACGAGAALLILGASGRGHADTRTAARIGGSTELSMNAGNCEAWCRSTYANWEQKCAWDSVACSGCAECASYHVPTAPPKPDFTAKSVGGFLVPVGGGSGGNSSKGGAKVPVPTEGPGPAMSPKGSINAVQAQYLNPDNVLFLVAKSSNDNIVVYVMENGAPKGYWRDCEGVQTGDCKQEELGYLDKSQVYGFDKTGNSIKLVCCTSLPVTYTQEGKQWKATVEVGGETMTLQYIYLILGGWDLSKGGLQNIELYGTVGGTEKCKKLDSDLKLQGDC